MDSVDDVLREYALNLKLEIMKRGVLSAFQAVAAVDATSPARASPRRVKPQPADGGAPPKAAHPTPTARDGKRERHKSGVLPDDPLLTAAEAAAERGQARSTFWRDVRAGRVPLAFYVSPRCPRWRRSELRAGVDACRARAKGAA